VLPTGRNFFALDPRVVPTPSAWRCGKALAESLLKRHFQDQGEPLRTLALVVWGTSNMRTGGDDLAQALWLWGCEPVWEENSGRVVDFKIIPASLLGRPRVDVTLRVSGLFRDTFGDTVRLLAAIPKRLALLVEPEHLNPVREAWLRDQAQLMAQGLSEENSARTAALRVFTSGPGCYGTGLLQVIDAGNWETQADLAAVFLRWGDHAAGADGQLTPEPDALRTRLSAVQAIAQNQDNREHDILDSDDYFQFQGGLQAAIETLRGSAPANYHGDSSDPALPRIRSLEEELVRVLHSRALNPRWIAAMQQHGYKGAFEIAATVDYLFGYSATTGLVRDHHFEAAAKSLILEQEAFFRAHNPDALRETSERLLEAAQRGLWADPNSATISSLETLLLSLEGERE
jgi:cobaltochelatase CobN